MKNWLILSLGIIIVVVALSNNGSRSLEDNNLRFVGRETKLKAASFAGGGEWINSEPLEIKALLAEEEVKALLVDIWTYSCVNCQRTLPYIRSWWDKYKDKGLVIVGVHSPEFDFEKSKENVIEATKKYGVTWPVVQDNEMKIWKAYKNNYWPRKYLINKAGEIVYDHIGEGGYEEMEKQIQKLLEVNEVKVTEEPEELGRAVSGTQQTPELYVNKRGQVLGHLGQGADKVELLGGWQLEGDYAEAGIKASLRLEFQAGEMNLVMSLADRKKRRVKVAVDGAGAETIAVADNDLYPLFKGKFGKHSLEMIFDEGVRAHAFTFGK